MKKLNSYLLLGAMIFCLSTLLTSCDEIFGEGDNPVPVIPPSPVVDEAKVLGAALEAGAIVSVTYNVGSTTYVATFVKNSDDSYTLQSNAKISAARALTRGVSDPTVTVGDGATVGDQVQLLLSGNKLKLVVKAANGNPLFEATMNIETGEIAIINTNAKGVNCTIGSFAVNGDTKDIKNPEMQNVTVNFAHTLVVPATSISLSLTFNYAVQYLNGETWADVIARYKACDHGEISTTDDDFISITFRKDIATEVIKAAVSTLDYNVAVLVTPDKIEELATAVSQTKLYLYTQEPVRSADVVDGNKTYVLSLQASVTYKKGAWDDTEKKVVFTNETATPTVVESADANVTWSDGWYTVSGNVTITGDGISNGGINMYGGKLTVTSSASTGTAIKFNTSGINVYGGELVAEATNTGSSEHAVGIQGSGVLTVYGGKVHAAGNGVSYSTYYGQAIHATIKSGTEGIKFYFSDDNTTWNAGTYYSTSTAAPAIRYAKVE